MSLSEAYDTDLYGNRIFIVEPVDPTNPRTGGYSTVLTGGANYNLPFRRGSLFHASLASEMRYYQLIRETQNVSQRLNIGLTTTLPGRTALFVNQRVRYSPSFLNSNLPQGPDDAEAGDIDPGSDYAGVLNLEDQYYYSTTFRLTRPVTRRTRLTVRGDLLRSDFVHESASRRDSLSRVLGGDFGWPLGRTTSATVGYRYRDNDVKNTTEINGSRNCRAHGRPERHSQASFIAIAPGAPQSSSWCIEGRDPDQTEHYSRGGQAARCRRAVHPRYPERDDSRSCVQLPDYEGLECARELRSRINARRPG